MKNENSLSGLRGFAAFMVVIHHYLIAFYPSLYNGNLETIKTNSGIEPQIATSPLNVIYNGNFFVCIFFVLSGYVLSYKFFKYKDDKAITSSAVRRYIRLMLPVLFSTTISYIFMKLNLFYNDKVALITGSNWWLAEFYNFMPNIFEMVKQALYGTFFENKSYYNGVLWTMQYELIGSFFVFGICSIFGRMRNRFVFYIIGILLVIYS